MLSSVGLNSASRSIGPRLDGASDECFIELYHSLFEGVGEVRDVHHEEDVDRELKQDREQNVEVEDVCQRSLL